MIEIPPMGALDEFERKKVRNDYPLMALWEMGVRKLRMPFQDLEDPRIRERMQVLRTLGHRFTVYTLEVPRQRARDLLIEHHEVVDAWEVVCSWPEVERTIAAIQEVKAKAPLSAYLSKLRSKEDVQREGSRYYHFINHGFIVSERPAVETLRRANGAASVIDGIVFRVVRQASPWGEIASVADIAAALGIRATCHLRMTSTNPAEEFRDDLANANRVAEALLAVLAVAARGQVDVFVDTFADIDRGYFVRNGLVDRRYNPRLGSHVVRNLYGALNASAKPVTRGGSHDVTSGRICTAEVEGEVMALVLPEQKIRVDRVPANRRDAISGKARRIDLETGRI